MEILTDREIKKYLKSGFLTKPFLDNELVKRKVELDFKSKINKGILYTEIESLCNWIGHVVSISKDEKFVADNKFQRNAKEIWESGNAVGCFDYAILFATFARQLGWPTAILATAEIDWFNNMNKKKKHTGHYFCECFCDNKWILVDPTSKKIQKDYSTDIINFSYDVNKTKKFVPYLRCIDLGEKQTIQKHNQNMDKLCAKIKNNELFL